MKYLIPMLICMKVLAVPASAADFTAPPVPKSGAQWMPDNTESFADGLAELLRSLLLNIRPDIHAALQVSLSLICAVLIIGLLRTFSGGVKAAAELSGAVTVAAMLLFNADAMIRLGSETVTELSEYGKLLWPVLTAAMAAQGGVTASAALYAGTAAFSTVLSGLISDLLVPMIYLYLALSIASSALGEDVLKKMRDLVKGIVSWCLKTLLMVFMTYMSITGVISGTTDAVTLKATKVTISSVVPVVGGILSDASEAVLIGAGMAKNAAGIYGILAVLAVFLEPFLKIGLHYLTLKMTSAVCELFGPKSMTELMGDVSSAMGLILGMTGSVCLLLLISVICFMKGVG